MFGNSLGGSAGALVEVAHLTFALGLHRIGCHRAQIQVRGTDCAASQSYPSTAFVTARPFLRLSNATTKSREALQVRSG